MPDLSETLRFSKCGARTGSPSSRSASSAAENRLRWDPQMFTRCDHGISLVSCSGDYTTIQDAVERWRLFDAQEPSGDMGRAAFVTLPCLVPRWGDFSLAW